MSLTVSPVTLHTYGVSRVCRVWETPRSTYYRHADQEASQGTSKIRRGPKPKTSDDQLLWAIRADLEQSPFVGEGHRKVHARLRILNDVRVSKNRVLRLMRENNLLSPHRARQGEKRRHEGTIITEEPNMMWGTDGAKVFTWDEGWVWVFSTVEHWNAECVGWHVCKYGTRFNALEAVKMGIETIFESVKGDVARGLSLRMDHGSQYLSDHFRNQIRYWGITPSWAFISQPETNGVAERFNRTLKEQAIYGNIFKNAREVRAAVENFVKRYNEEWLIEKLGFRSPAQARRDHGLAEAA